MPKLSECLYTAAQDLIDDFPETPTMLRVAEMMLVASKVIGNGFDDPDDRLWLGALDGLGPYARACSIYREPEEA